ncbi:MAG: glycosyltransferase [Anaerolineae bacterium]|nr:glycosyltransferase [Anaerolineae bacterium]
MRILFTFIGGIGHFVPLVSVARTAVTMNHTITFGCGPGMVATVAAAGFTVFSLGTGAPGPPEKRPLHPLDAAREDQEFRDRFARRGAQNRVPQTIALCQEWQPDLLVCDETDFGSMIAAEYLGLPYATVLVMAAGSFVRTEVVGEALNELRADYALPPDPRLEMLSRHLALSPFPPGFRDPAYPLPPTGFSFRPAPSPNEKALAWLTSLPDQPTVYFTLGTVFNLESGDLFTRVLAGLRDLPVNVIVTVGPFLDPAELGPQPANVYIEQYIAQDLILPHCQLIVSHGGSGSVSGALLHGRPSLLIPMGADQLLNAARCQQLGLGKVLDPIEATSDSVQTAATELLADPGYQHAATRMRDEFRALPGPDDAVRLLEELV